MSKPWCSSTLLSGCFIAWFCSGFLQAALDTRGHDLELRSTQTARQNSAATSENSESANIQEELKDSQNEPRRDTTRVRRQSSPLYSCPKILINPSSLTVNENEAAWFQCSATGKPEPAVVWSKVSGSLPDSRSAAFNGRLEIPVSKMSDAGIYECTATNRFGVTRKQVKLVINAPPRIYLHPGPLHIIEGDNVTLPRCYVTGYPEPTITWKRSSGPVPRDRSDVRKGLLTIHSTLNADTDAYICEASNFLGSSSSATLLVVKGLARPGDLYVCAAVAPALAKRSGVEAPVHMRVLGPEKDCSDLYKAGITTSGVYSINPDGRGSFSVYCDMTTDGGGWTVFQRRQDGSQDFYQGWSQYKVGFGQLNGEFWLGNDDIHRLTANRPSEIRVELEDWSGGRVYAKYGRFRVGNERSLYTLSVGSYSGTAGDSLTYHANMVFTTKERDNDKYAAGNCALSCKGAWWYNRCHYSNLNGQYLRNKTDARGVGWYQYKQNYLSFKFAEMKVRPAA